MELRDIATVIKELVLPELKEIRYEQAEIKTALTLTNKRLDDVNTHLADQSRRIDETNKRIDETNKRIDETNKRIDAVQTDLSGRLENVRAELTGRLENVRAELSGRLENVRAELIGRIDDIILRIDKTNERLDQLYLVNVRRDEHEELKNRLSQLERDVAEIKHRLAA